MKILSIDTSSNLCTIAILENTKCVKELIINDARNHSEKIMPVINKVLQETNLSLQNIDLIVCDKGPGSFTGIRIGVGTVLAFQDSLNIPCVGISSLETLAYNVSDNGFICTLIDAKNNNVYYSLYKHSGNDYLQIAPFAFKTIDDVISSVKSYDFPIYFVGDGAILHKNLIESNIQNCLFIEKNDISSYSLGLAGYNSYIKNINTTVMPLYLRKSQAERVLEEKQKRSDS